MIIQYSLEETSIVPPFIGVLPVNIYSNLHLFFSSVIYFFLNDIQKGTKMEQNREFHSSLSSPLTLFDCPFACTLSVQQRNRPSDCQRRGISRCIVLHMILLKLFHFTLQLVDPQTTNRHKSLSSTLAELCSPRDPNKQKRAQPMYSTAIIQ